MADVSRFKVNQQQLTDLMDFHDRGGKNSTGKLEEMGGIVQITADLDANLKEGLSKSTEEIEARMKVFGRNYIDPIPPKSFLALVLDALQDKVLIILICAAIVSIVISEIVAPPEDRSTAWFEGAAILVAVLLVVTVTAINDWTKERKFRALQQRLESSSKYTVVREGRRFELPTAGIVVGDLVEFKYGNTFPCDGLLVQGNDVRVTEASLTGESKQLKKTPEDPFLYAGTQVMEGAGSMIVVAVGPYSQQGIIFQLLAQKSGEEAGFITQAIRKCIRRFKKVPDEAEEPVEAPSSESVLQKKLTKLALRIGYIAIAAAILCLIITTLKFSITNYGINGESARSSDALQFLNFFITAITVVVVAVPEGLPLAVTIALAFSVQKMLKDNNLVRHLHSCETMGNATCICSDKTGTLTTNRMTVVDSYVARRRYTDTYPVLANLPRLIVEVMQQNIAVNSSYSSKLEPPRESDGEGSGLFSWLSKLRLGRRRGSQPSEEQELMGVRTDDGTLSLEDLLPREGRLPSQIGNVTECALLGLLVQLGINYEVIRSEYPRETIVKQFTFNSARKSMSTVIPLPTGGYRLLTKGASEIVLDKCTHIIDNNGDSVELTEEMKDEMKSTVVQNMASNALRTLCLAYRDFPSENETDEKAELQAAAIDWEDEDNVVSQLTCIAIVGIQDPVRPEVAASIRMCQLAGITVRMVTGDNIETARAIAEKCGIIERGDRKKLVMEGKVFKKRVTGENNEVIQDKVDRIWPRLRVLARSSPQDKYVLVDGIISSELNKKREVVAVTGDGTNDGPALKRADVGFAMGIAGTDVAKQACDIILTDDNFTSIVKAVMWGRNVYDAISKFLQFQLTVNVVAVLLVLVGAVVIGDTPLRAIQLLWVNLVMDSLGSLALATESPTPELLKRAPYGRNRALLSRRMILFILGHSVYQLAVLVTLLVAGDTLFDIDKADALDHSAPPTEHLTIIFNTFVFMQLFNEINARKVHGEHNVFKGIHRNFIFIGVMVTQITLQILWIEVPYVNSQIFTTTPLSADLWLWCVFLGSVELVWGQLIQLIPVEKFPKINLPLPWFRDEPEPPKEFDPQLLWIKSLTRLRTQIRVVNAFKAGLESGDNLHISRLPMLHSTPRSARYYGAELFTRETEV